jgi:superfamily II DNA/RNA helicase
MHCLVHCGPNCKILLSQLINFLKTKMNENEKLIVFVGRKAFADHLSSELSLLRLQCVCIHGGLPQCERDRVITTISEIYLKRANIKGAVSQLRLWRQIKIER